MSNLLSQASLVMIPSGYKEDVVYSQIPTDGSGDLTFTRASNGTRVNSAGLVEVCPWNLAEYSEEFNNAVYVVKNAVTITNNATTAPNGTTTADLVYPSSSGDFRYVAQAFTQPENIYTLSVYAKAQNKSVIWMYIESSAGTGIVYFDLSDGTMSVTAGSSSTPIGTMTAVGNGWYRCTYTLGASMSLVSGSGFGVCDAKGNVYATASGTNGVYFWGYQLNIGNTAKPYFPTTDRLNVPRLTYQNGGGGCPSLLLEKQSTNLTLYSEQFDNAVHYNLGFTIAPNNITSPDGTQNADKFTETTGTGEHVVYDIDSNATGTYTLSAFFKGGAGTIYPVLRLNGSNTTAYAGCIFNTSTGAVVNTFYNTYSAPTTKVENMGNGWYRVSMTTTTTDTNFGMRIAASNSTSPSVGAYGAISYTGNTSNYFYAYGAQLEASSYPTSYIPTTSSSATRVADACYKTGISSLIGQTEGTLFCDIVPTDVSGQGRFMNVLNSTDVNNGWIAIISSGSNTFRFYGDGFDFSGGACLFGVRAKVALAYKNGVVTSAYVNGTSVNTLTAVTTSKSYNQLSLGEGPFGNNGSCNVNQAVIFSTALTNAELASLTTL